MKMYHMLVFLLCWISFGYGSYRPVRCSNHIRRVDDISSVIQKIKDLNFKLADGRLSYLDDPKSDIHEGVGLLRVIRNDVINRELAEYFATASQNDFDAIYKKANLEQRAMMLELRNKK